MRLRAKILAGYGIVLAMTVVVLVWAVVNLVKLGLASRSVLRENYQSILAADNMLALLERQDSAALFLLAGWPDEGLRQFRANETQFLQWLARARDNITEQGEAATVAAIESGYAAYLVEFTRLQTASTGDGKSPPAVYRDSMLPVFEKVRSGCLALRDLNQAAMFASSDRAEALSVRAVLSTVAVGVAALVIALWFSLLLSKMVVRPLARLTEATRKVAAGEYDVEVPPSSRDELGRLSGEFNAMARKLRAYNDLNIGKIVAEKRKSEAIIDSIDDGIIVVEADLKVSGVNPPAGNLLGVSIDAAIGRHFLEVVKNDRLLAYVKETIDSGKPPQIDEENRILTARVAGERRHYLFSVRPVLTDAGVMQGVVLLLRDVTRMKEVERLKSEFVMTASHQLRTPLTSIGMSVDLLRESAGKLDERERQLLDAAHEELQRLRALVNDLLELSRIEAGRIDLQFDKVDVRALFDRAASTLKAQAGEKRVSVEYSVEDNLPPMSADFAKLTWVLTNLVANSIRHVESGGHVRLSAQRSGAWVQVSVKDDGEGIPYEYQSRIFDKFIQVKDSRHAGGTGLGLAICKEIVRAHRGAIWLESTPGEGATFTFTIPAA